MDWLIGTAKKDRARKRISKMMKDKNCYKPKDKRYRNDKLHKRKRDIAN